jgi:hypothetical protein
MEARPPDRPKVEEVGNRIGNPDGRPARAVAVFSVGRPSRVWDQSLKSCLPKFFPEKRRNRVAGMFSNPSWTSSLYWSSPFRSQASSCRWTLEDQVHVVGGPRRQLRETSDPDRNRSLRAGIDIAPVDRIELAFECQEIIRPERTFSPWPGRGLGTGRAAWREIEPCVKIISCPRQSILSSICVRIQPDLPRVRPSRQ